ncbi:hypothetical protein [Aeromonas dhakensis]|uniref:hypothetical protein n=1 Tax=Aeromonas dhakensis TaxID=196024 RepID=UPI00344AD06C
MMTLFPVHMVLPWHKVNGLPAGNPLLLYKKVAILTSFHRIAQGASLNAVPTPGYHYQPLDPARTFSSLSDLTLPDDPV